MLIALSRWILEGIQDCIIATPSLTTVEYLNGKFRYADWKCLDSLWKIASKTRFYNVVFGKKNVVFCVHTRILFD